MIKVNSDSTVLSTPSTSKEVEKVNKDSVLQGTKINAASEHLVASQFKEKENNLLAPSLRVPREQKNNNIIINVQDDIKDQITTFSSQNKNIKSEVSQLNKSDIENKNTDFLTNKNHLYDQKREDNSIISKKQSSSTPSKPNQSKNKDYNFLFLQLSYQNIIDQNVLDRIKDPDKLDHYLNKLNELSQGIDGLKEKINSLVDEIKNNKNAYIDYWMEIYSQIKDKKFKTEKDVAFFLKNNKIPNSLIKELLSGKIKSKEDMEKLIEKNFPFMKLPTDISKTPLDELNGVYEKLSTFFDDVFKYMPDIPMSDDKLSKITTHRDELKALINKKENKSVKGKLEEIRETYRTLTVSQSALELEIMSDSLSGMALLTFLLAKTRELTLKVMLQRTENEQKLFEEMQEVTEKSLKDKIKDQKAQLKKQEEIQYWAGIGLKILSGLLAFVAGVASIFTAGASMVLMAVAITLFVADVALTVADEVVQATTGKSFMDEVMAPISESIMKAIDKIVDFLADAINSTIDGLKAFGIDKKAIEEMKSAIQEKLKMALQIIIAIVLFAAAMALSFVIGPIMKGITDVANKIFNQQMRNTLKRVLHDTLEAVLGKMIKEIIIQAVEEAMEKINKQLAKDISKKASIMLNRTVVVSKLVNSTATNAVNIYSTVISANILQSVADSKKLDAILNLIQKLMDKIMESYHESIDAITEILKKMSEGSSISNKVKSDMIKSMSF
ncbi:type III secretion system translocon subunit SctE [Hafnia alvei]|uniref:type III secretion system translocon subunit SctE n=1 Tax=Proteus vulgaris TaxID=585 RepID=UPI00299DE07A|nr:type III secretion system translocon subunit SctE [Proteus vulgaris]WOO49378.1 type III secretion system translocon subunit SctE [Hafnia alvei]WPF03844.1 type III secretion system translocon subunit SctE [Proteus vulgaris]